MSNNYVTSEEFAIRLLEIQTRIAYLRRRYGWDEKPSKKNTAEQKIKKTCKTNTSKEDEMNDIKAKLLGRKK